MPASVVSYVAAGCGDERTQDANVAAGKWGLVLRMLVGATERDLSIELFGMKLPTPLFMSPIGVIGLCAQDGHGEIATARAAAETGVPMIASTLMVDPLEVVAAEFGDTLGFFQLYTPTDRELAASLVQRAERAGFKAIVVTLDTWLTGWRHRDLATSNFPQLRGHGLANYFTDPRFRELLGVDPADDLRSGDEVGGNFRQPPDLGRSTVASVVDEAAADPERHLPSRRCSARDRRRHGRHLLFQSRPTGERWSRGAGPVAGCG
jgi:lactate 2-monooxygenase